MKKVLFIALVISAGCHQAKKPLHTGKIEVAVYEGYPVHHGQVFEVEAVFIPIEQLGIHEKGDTVFVDTAGFIRELPLRYIDNNHIYTDTTGLTRLIINDRVLANKFIKR